MSKYMTVLFVSGLAPFVLSFWPPLKFYRNWPSLLRSLLLILIIFGSWDCFAVLRGHWYFNPQGVGDVKIVNLPLEEVLFFVVIPFCCIFTWEIVKYIGIRIK
jgi:lycopene cyclase domain-containing protein